MENIAKTQTLHKRCTNVAQTLHKHKRSENLNFGEKPQQWMLPTKRKHFWAKPRVPSIKGLGADHKKCNSSELRIAPLHLLLPNWVDIDALLLLFLVRSDTISDSNLFCPFTLFRLTLAPFDQTRGTWWLSLQLNKFLPTVHLFLIFRLDLFVACISSCGWTWKYASHSYSASYTYSTSYLLISDSRVPVNVKVIFGLPQQIFSAVHFHLRHGRPVPRKTSFSIIALTRVEGDKMSHHY